MSADTTPPAALTPQEQHREHHRVLHHAYCQLVHEYLEATSKGAKFKLLSTTSLEELMRWSHAQCVRPTEHKP